MKDEFSKAFNEPDPVEDAATDEAAVEQAIAEVDAVLSDDSTDAVPDDASAEGATDSAAEAVTMSEGATGGDMPEGGVEDDDVPPEDEQAYRSWKGRMKKREQEIAAREAAIAEREAALQASAEAPAEEMPPEPVMRADGGEIDADEGGDMDDEGEAADGAPASLLDDLKAEAEAMAGDPAKLESIMGQMVEDYGREYVVGLMAVVAPMVDVMAKPYIGQVDSALASMVDDVTNAFRSMHIDSIKDAHEDYEEIVAGDEFRAWRESLEGDERARVDQVMSNGTAGQVVKMLTDFKTHLKGGPEQSISDAWAEDAAAAVKGSAPVRLPKRQGLAPDDEFRAAFNSDMA